MASLHHSQTGIITVSGVLDIEVKDNHIFEVTAIGASGVSATGTVAVIILNINDYPPVIGQTFNFSVPEDATNGMFLKSISFESLLREGITQLVNPETMELLHKSVQL